MDPSVPSQYPCPDCAKLLCSCPPVLASPPSPPRSSLHPPLSPTSPRSFVLASLDPPPPPGTAPPAATATTTIAALPPAPDPAAAAPAAAPATAAPALALAPVLAPVPAPVLALVPAPALAPAAAAATYPYPRSSQIHFSALWQHGVIQAGTLLCLILNHPPTIHTIRLFSRISGTDRVSCELLVPGGPPIDLRICAGPRGIALGVVGLGGVAGVVPSRVWSNFRVVRNGVAAETLMVARRTMARAQGLIAPTAL